MGKEEVSHECIVDRRKRLIGGILIEHISETNWGPIYGAGVISNIIFKDDCLFIESNNEHACRIDLGRKHDERVRIIMCYETGNILIEDPLTKINWTLIRKRELLKET